MITYDQGKWGVLFACTLKGSVFPKAAVWAFPCSIAAILLHILLNSSEEHFNQLGAGDVGASVLTGFTFILGFLVVFRSQQAYARWWEGGTLLQQLRGEWFNAFSSLMAFCNKAPDKEEDVIRFQHKLARLFSLLYSAALSQVSTLKTKDFELIDIDDFEKESMDYLMKSHDRCEVCLQWIQRLIGDANDELLLKVAPPILSRVYNQLGNGIVNLNNARKITEFPIPFPLAQMISFMLLFHWLITAFICAASVDRSFWAGILSFIVTFSFQSINYIAVELEMPFGDDANDLPLHEMQSDLNASLRSLMDKRAQHPPIFNFKAGHKMLRCRGQTMEDIFATSKNEMENGDTSFENGDSSFDSTAPSPDNEKSSGNAMVLQAATNHGARPKENMQMCCEPQVAILPSVTPEIWFHMGPKDDNSIWRPDVEAQWNPHTALSVAPSHNALAHDDAPKVSPTLRNALTLGGAATVSTQLSSLTDLPVQLQPPPAWEPCAISAMLTPLQSALPLGGAPLSGATAVSPQVSPLQNLPVQLQPPPVWERRLGPPNSRKLRPPRGAPDMLTETGDAAGLPGRLQALQERNDAASFPAALAAPSTVWGSNEPQFDAASFQRMTPLTKSESPR